MSGQYTNLAGKTKFFSFNIIEIRNLLKILPSQGSLLRSFAALRRREH
jgi:hypothetical protein